jgi:two-component system, NarL family, sensor histidine kinase DesK
LPVVVESALSWALREGVTNIIRHSRGQACAIRVVESSDDVVVLEIVDTGRGRIAGPVSAESHGGTGLAGVAERVAEVGGNMSAGPDPGGGFRLTVTVSRSADRVAPA